MSKEIGGEISPIGRTIDHVSVIGIESDGSSRWVGADLELSIPPIGRFFLNVVTKHHYAETHLKDHEDMTERLELLLQPLSAEQREPFVLNDSVVTEGVVQRKFIGRTVEEDLAASLWYLGPIEQGQK